MLFFLQKPLMTTPINSFLLLIYKYLNLSPQALLHSCYSLKTLKTLCLLEKSKIHDLCVNSLKKRPIYILSDNKSGLYGAHKSV